MTYKYGYGYAPMEPVEEERPRCPICGEELNFNTKVYKQVGGDIIGCENCVDTFDAEDI